MSEMADADQTVVDEEVFIFVCEDPRRCWLLHQQLRYNPNRVIVKNLVLLVDGRPDTVLDLSPGNLEAVKKNVFVIKEGIQYRIAYLKHQVHLFYNVYHPSIRGFCLIQSYTSPMEEMPTGLLARGTYNVKSLFTDDDNHQWLKWDWNFELKKDW
ncbi:unnamed protein product [Oppiella nova]|uniref:Uncharacterized protein n=1 Tax=Oppiella nova TaxID=334625 RepID=A0A7R9M4R6_9ACAR|nr:unnamed protein product [Oppiella nova]CAG2170648.1 unnamed protein product [Oppiella nova]